MKKSRSPNFELTLATKALRNAETTLARAQLDHRYAQRRFIDAQQAVYATQRYSKTPSQPVVLKDRAPNR